MKEDKSKKDEEVKVKVKARDIPTSSEEKKVEAKPKLKTKARLKKKKYPIVLVGKNYVVYKTEKGNGWAGVSDASNYKVSEEFEV